ncbi:MAG: hypothetical protein MUC50_15300 [Myxococcota bacterium]|nr:hypothetical protein [Myxococcota bacterium]
MRTLVVIWILSTGLSYAACKGESSQAQDAAPDQTDLSTDASPQPGNQPRPTVVTTLNPTPDGLDPTNAQAVIFHQIELLRTGNVEELKKWFTPRLQAELTPQTLRDAVAAAQKMPTKEELAQTVEVRDVDGKRVAEVNMDGGRTLTTMILTDGKWLSDTLWFK